MAKNPEDILKELEMLTQEIKEKKAPSSQQKSTSKKKKTTTSSCDKPQEENNKVKVTKELTKSLDLLEKEVFIKIDNPASIAHDLINSKKVVKNITAVLMALTKVNKLREELLQNLNENIEDLKKLVSSLERNLNLDEYGEALRKVLRHLTSI